VFWWQGRQTAVARDHNGLLLEQVPHSGCLSWCTGPASHKYGKALVQVGLLLGPSKRQWVLPCHLLFDAALPLCTV
jgi:hypothetical protein